MRYAVLMIGLLVLGAPHALAQPTPSTPFAAEQLAERRALLAVDGRCRLLEPPVRMALTATAAQARASLLRAGWDSGRVSALEDRAHASGARRACTDEAVRAAAGRARSGYRAWTNLQNLSLPGAYRSWEARRQPEAGDWRLWQELGQAGARFGAVSGHGGAVLELSATGPLPAAAVLRLRNRTVQGTALLDVPARIERGLAAKLPPPGLTQPIFAAGRQAAAGRVRFTFPVDTWAALAALDPREAVGVEVGTTRLLLEVGDLTTARAFLQAGR